MHKTPGFSLKKKFLNSESSLTLLTQEIIWRLFFLVGGAVMRFHQLVTILLVRAINPFGKRNFKKF